ELILINETLNNLIDLYKKDSSEEILSVIEKMLESIVILVKEAKKLPLYEKEELYKDITYKKEYFKKLSDKEKEDLPEVIEETILVKPFLSLGLKEQLERFNSIVEELEVILPAAVITDFYLKLNSSEKIDFLKFMLETKTEDETEEEIYKIVAYLDYLKKKNDNNYLYNKIQSWS
ncbi:MAG: hypothetical protein IJ970_00085, partial [Mycoplasmataceae bacterium]|nr:hypothetical protein [Mycoplasmataceae bacterium]